MVPTNDAIKPSVQTSQRVNGKSFRNFQQSIRGVAQIATAMSEIARLQMKILEGECRFSRRLIVIRVRTLSKNDGKRHDPIVTIKNKLLPPR